MCGSADPAMLSGPPLTAFERECLRMVIDEHCRVVELSRVGRELSGVLAKKRVDGKFIVWPVKNGRGDA